jgi:hypothetical protein
MKLEFFRQIFEKSSNTKFHENPSSGSRVVQCGRTDMMKLIVVAFRSFANAAKNQSIERALWVAYLKTQPTQHRLTDMT